MSESFFKSVSQSFTVIFLSELADRTFILVLLYASKLTWFPLLLTSLLSMGLMNIFLLVLGDELVSVKKLFYCSNNKK